MIKQRKKKGRKLKRKKKWEKRFDNDVTDQGTRRVSGEGFRRNVKGRKEGRKKINKKMDAFREWHSH